MLKSPITSKGTLFSRVLDERSSRPPSPGAGLAARRCSYRLIFGSKHGGRRSLATLVRSETEILRVSETQHSLTILTPLWALTNVHLPHGWHTDAELLAALDAIDPDLAQLRRFEHRRAAKPAPGEGGRHDRSSRTRVNSVPLLVTGDVSIQFTSQAEPTVGPYLDPTAPRTLLPPKERRAPARVR